MALHQPCLSISTSTSSVENLSLFLRNSQQQQQQQCSYRPTIATISIAAAPLLCLRRTRTRGVVFVGKEETELRVSDSETQVEQQEDPTPEDLEYFQQIKRTLELLTKNRDMIFSEVKLTIMIEDPRDVERRRLLGIDDSEAPTRDDLVAALEDWDIDYKEVIKVGYVSKKVRYLQKMKVNEGRIPKNRVALRMLAEEMINWPNLEEEAPKKKPSKSLYAKVTDTGVDPKVAAKRLNIDWDSAAEIEDSDASDDADVNPVVGYGALYLVTAFPVIIGISVVLILFYNSLQ